MQDALVTLAALIVPSTSPTIPKLEFAIKWLHLFLYDAILSNAGNYRLSSDPQGGLINFGGQKRNEALPKYQGSSPSNIKSDVQKSLSYLVGETADPIESALRFYQAFVRCHPYYDGNGRIGRLIVTLFLRFHDLHVLWSEMEAGGNSKFIKKLNHCHDRQGQPNFDQYLSYLVDYFRKYVRPFSEYDDVAEE